MGTSMPGPARGYAMLSESCPRDNPKTRALGEFHLHRRRYGGNFIGSKNRSLQGTRSANRRERRKACFDFLGRLRGRVDCTNSGARSMWCRGSRYSRITLTRIPSGSSPSIRWTTPFLTRPSKTWREGRAGDETLADGLLLLASPTPPAPLPTDPCSPTAAPGLFPIPRSMASLASLSASLFPPRSVWAIWKRSSRLARRLASSQRGLRPGLATL